jgi:hypothetical protein
MGTRSTIALEFADGTVQQVYCHWDGYLEGNGAMLEQHYMDPFKVKQLLALGGFSSLEASVADTKKTAYHSARGEELMINKFKDFEDYKANHQYEEYEYILRQVDGKAVWFVADHDNVYITLKQAFIDEQDRIAQEETAE